MQIKGIGRVKAIQLKAVGELAIRMSRPSNYKKIKLRGTKDLADILQEEMKNEKREIIKLVLLNSKMEILKIIDVAHGGINSANVTESEIISEALKSDAPNMIVVHNHPSGDATPSEADIQFTDTLYNEAKRFNIELMDHVIIAGDDYKSVYEELRKRIEKLKRENKT
jgi:DNA repair protein RadC